MNNMPDPLSYTYSQNFQQQIPENPMAAQYYSSGNYGTMVNEMHISDILERYIGKIMKAEFLIGGEVLDDKLGRLLSVGKDYIVLGMLESKVIMVCKTDALKFITVILDEETSNIEF